MMLTSARYLTSSPLQPGPVEKSAFSGNVQLTGGPASAMFTVNTDWTAMRLGSLLHLVGLNRNTFNTLNRRTPLPFMDRDLLNERSYDRYTMTHAVAVACVVELMSAGVVANRAVTAVDSMMASIDAAVATLAAGEADDNWWITVINFADGTYGWASGKENADTFGGGVILNKVSINIVAVWSAMAQRLGTPVDDNNLED